MLLVRYTPSLLTQNKDIHVKVIRYTRQASTHLTEEPIFALESKNVKKHHPNSVQSALLHRTQRIRCSFYSSKDQAKSRGEFRRRWASIQPDILLTGLLFVSLQKQNLFI